MLYVGNIKPHKNLVRLIEAFNELRTGELRGPQAPHHRRRDLQVAGAATRVHRHKLHKHVRFLGYVPDDQLAVLYRLAAVFVFPSLYEGFGLPPLEAMASGTPVVVSNVSSLPEVVGDAAVLVDPHDIDSIVDGLRSVLTNPRAPTICGGKDSSVRASSRGSVRSPVRWRSIDASVRRSRSPPYEGRARSRLADRHARRREGARGGLRTVSRRRDPHAVPLARLGVAASSGTGSIPRSCSIPANGANASTGVTCRCSRSRSSSSISTAATS